MEEPLAADYQTVTASNPLVTRLILLSALSAFVASAAFFAWKVKEGLTLLEFFDETEQFVVAQMVFHGHHLYKDVFSHHGPLPYIVAHLYTLLFSPSDFSYIRLAQVALALLSCAALVASPVFKANSVRLLAGALYLLLLALFWNLQGFNLLHYSQMVGFLFVIILAQCTVPSIFLEHPSRFGLFASGFAVVLALYCAFSYGPAAFIFLLSSVLPLLLLSNRRQLTTHAGILVLGMLTAAVLIGAWLVMFGDLKGFFVYHFYLNQQVYAPFIDIKPTAFLKNLSLSLAPHEAIHSLALVFFVVWICIFLLPDGRPVLGRMRLAKIAAVLCAALGVLLTEPLGRVTFDDSGFIATNFALFGLAAGMVLERYLTASSHRRMGWPVLLTAGAILLAIRVSSYATSWPGYSQDELKRHVSVMKPLHGGIYDFVRSVTKKDGDFLALNYAAHLYLKLDRLPASGNLFYLPWQAAYNRRPLYGYHMDICADIREKRPAIIWFFNWRVWNKYSVDEYEPCVLSLITEGYTPIDFGSPWHIRNDLRRLRLPLALRGSGVQTKAFPEVPPVMQPSEPLSPLRPINLMMAPTHEVRSIGLQRIGILFRTYGRKNAGAAELSLVGPNGAGLVQRFSLSELIDDKLHYFALDSNRYTSGQIRAVTGGGVSTWESHLIGAPAYTCIIYEYADGVRRYTPACPIF
jgi:hypothetical protein